MENVSFTLGEVTYSVKITLRLWLELEEIDKNISKAMKGKSMLEASTLICSYLSVVTKIDVEELKTLFWFDIADAYISIFLGCIPTVDFPLFHGKSEKEDSFVWDYEGRTWYIWSHMLASKYGWSLEYIGDLYFEDAIALVQEILIDEQLQKEWEWSLSELAYPYNSVTKKSEFKALPRPSWMTSMAKIKPPEVVKMPIEMMPVGNVIRWRQDETIIN